MKSLQRFLRKSRHLYILGHCVNYRQILGDYNALTPGHLLPGGPINAIPSVLNINENRLTRWQFVVKLHQDFWRSWSADYLNERQQRPKKWTTRRENLKEGDIVI